MAILTDTNYVDKAEKTIKSLGKNRKGEFYLSTSQLRNILNLSSSLYDEARYKDYADLEDRIAYLKVRIVYAAGRESAVKELVYNGDLLKIIDEIEDKESLIRFCHYMEALVAYLKFYGGE